jgi:hypothetical protein
VENREIRNDEAKREAVSCGGGARISALLFLLAPMAGHLDYQERIIDAHVTARLLSHGEG